MPRSLAAAVLLALPAGAAAQPAGGGLVPVHGRAEVAVTAAADAAPDTGLTAEFTSPKGRTVKAAGFWDGGRGWKVRFRPDEPGVWRYKTASTPEVAGLHGVAGTVEAKQGEPASPFLKHGPIRVAKSGTYLEHADGTPFFLLADTCWTGPALSTPADWQTYLRDRKGKRFSAVQFNIVSPWRTAPTDADGRTAYTGAGDTFRVNPEFYRRVDARTDAVNDAGLLAAPVLCWAHKKGDAGVELAEADIVKLVKYELARYGAHHVLWILAGDNGYKPADAEKWKRIGRAAFGDRPNAPVTTHPTGRNCPWKGWEDEKWLTVFGYQSGHGDSPKTWQWLHSGPPAEYGKRREFARPVVNLEPPYEAHNGYNSKQPHTDYSTRRAVYWSLLVHPPAGVTYGGHGVWGWNTKPGSGPVDHESTGPAKHWKEALNLPGAAQMGVMAETFAGLPWWDLRPAPDLVKSQPGVADPTKFIAAAATPDRSCFVVYVPDQRAAGFDHLAPEVGGPDGMRRLTFVDPATGARTTASLATLGPPGPNQTDVLIVFDGRRK